MKIYETGRELGMSRLQPTSTSRVCGASFATSICSCFFVAYPSRPRSTVNSELASHQQTPPSIPNKRFQTVIGMLHSQISQHRNGNIFHNPIKNSEAPDYHDIIKRPMDLKTIKARVKDGVISNSLEFQRDVYLMFANAMMYNRPSSDIYHMAEEVRIIFSHSTLPFDSRYLIDDG